MYTPDPASFHSRTSIPMMTMMTMMVVVVMVVVVVMMMIMNNNSWRKPANEIISNDSASFLLVML
jgi:preprotein translocase subunit SecG